jgi:hypothetical protein
MNGTQVKLGGAWTGITFENFGLKFIILNHTAILFPHDCSRKVLISSLNLVFSQAQLNCFYLYQDSLKYTGGNLACGSIFRDSILYWNIVVSVSISYKHLITDID